MSVDFAHNSMTWSERQIVAEYAASGELQPAEETILTLLRGELADMRMLDIGVGAGRTMLHFAPAVRQYWGIDYSAAMIAACERRRPIGASHITLSVCDARAMGGFPDGFFDFICFSYNGIDYVSHRDRLAIFAEVKRIGAAGALFCFSSHNLQDLRHFSFSAQWGGSLGPTAASLRAWCALRFRHNRIFSLKKLRRLPYAAINDGVHGNRLLTYYVKPAEQLEQLAPFFEDVRAFRSSDGAMLQSLDDLRAAEDPWIYYLCRIRK